MEAIEFQTTLGKDGIISIPENIGRNVKRGKVRVIVIEDEPKMFDRDETNDRDRDRAKDYIKFLMANPIKVDRSKPFLTRDEIYGDRL